MKHAISSFTPIDSSASLTSRSSNTDGSSATMRGPDTSVTGNAQIPRALSWARQQKLRAQLQRQMMKPEEQVKKASDLIALTDRYLNQADAVYHQVTDRELDIQLAQLDLEKSQLDEKVFRADSIKKRQDLVRDHATLESAIQILDANNKTLRDEQLVELESAFQQIHQMKKSGASIPASLANKFTGLESEYIKRHKSYQLMRNEQLDLINNTKKKIAELDSQLHQMQENVRKNEQRLNALYSAGPKIARSSRNDMPQSSAVKPDALSRAGKQSTQQAGNGKPSRLDKMRLKEIKHRTAAYNYWSQTLGTVLKAIELRKLAMSKAR